MTIDQGQINTRERALSSDVNRQVQLGNRAIVESLSAAASGSARESGIFGDGFLVTPLNGTMKSAIAPGLALYYDSTKVYPLSTMVWCESREVREVTHGASNPGLPRWDVIEMRPGSAVASTQPRDQFDPLTGTFTVVNMVKEVKSYPEFQIRSGTASASPGVPAGVAGWIPLAYVLVPAGAISVDQTKIVYCRPILSSRGIDREGWTTSPLNSIYATNVIGGGISFSGGDIDNGLVVNTLSGRFGQTVKGQYHHNFRVSKTVSVKITSMTWDGGVLPAADTLAYFYAIPPPYPAGYDASLAGREIWTPNIANLYGASGGFYDVSLQNGCIIIGSTKAPDVTHPAGPSTGTGSFAHEFFAEAGTADSEAASWVYIGSGYYVNATVEILAQNTINAWVAPARKTGKTFDADLPIAGPITYNMWTGFIGAPMVLPITARRLSMFVGITLAANASLHIEMEDDWTGAGALLFKGAPSFNLRNTAVGSETVVHALECAVNSDGNLKISEATANGVVSTAALIARAYEDAVLASR
jgi:hypothetical protein